MGNEESKDILHSDGKRIAWFWQSNTDQDPWKVPEDQWEWTPYTTEQAIIIEKAYLEKRKAVDLGEYRVLIPSMIQYKKGETDRQRRVLRKEIEESFRQDRFSEEPSKPKSVNTPFGTLNDFTRFLMDINSKCIVFDGLELGKATNLCFMFDNTPFVCTQFTEEKRKLKEERSKLEKLLIEGILNEGQILNSKENSQAKELSKQIAETMKNTPLPKTSEEMYKLLMNMYTQDTFLYSRINKILREENWEDFSNLAPFIFYLAKAFQAKTLAPKPEEIKTWGYLYRGMTLPQDSISFYDPSKTKYFSWYAFTSTSKSPKVAEVFKSKAPELGKIGALFTFDISNCDPSQLVSVSQVSKFQTEEEVIIAPATLYEIISTELKDDKCYVQVKVLPPNDVQRRMKQGEITLDGLRTKSLEQLKADVIIRRTMVEISYQNDIHMKDAVSILSNAKEVKSLLLRDSVFERFGLVGLFKMLQNKNLQGLILDQTTIKNEAVSLLPKEPLKDLRYLQITSSATEDQVLPKLLGSLCGESLQTLSFSNLIFFAGGLRPLISLADSTNLLNLSFEDCTFTPANLQNLEQAIPQMGPHDLAFASSKASDLLQTPPRIPPKMSALKVFCSKTDEIKQEAYHAFTQCPPGANPESLTPYGDTDGEGASLLADALAKSRVIEVCVSSTQAPEGIFLGVIVPRVRMNICAPRRFTPGFTYKENNFDHIIELLCKYKIYSFKFGADEVTWPPIYQLIRKLPETHLLSLSPPKKVVRNDHQYRDVLWEIADIADHGEREIRLIMHELEKVLKDSKLKEICLPKYSVLTFVVYFFLRKFKLKEINRDNLLDKILQPSLF